MFQVEEMEVTACQTVKDKLRQINKNRTNKLFCTVFSAGIKNEESNIVRSENKFGKL